MQFLANSYFRFASIHFTLPPIRNQQHLPNSTLPGALSSRATGAARQGWSGTGYFVEDKESLGANPLKSAEQKKLLSAVEKSGLLSRAEKAGLTLTRVRHHVRILLIT